MRVARGDQARCGAVPARGVLPARQPTRRRQWLRASRACGVSRTALTVRRRRPAGLERSPESSHPDAEWFHRRRSESGNARAPAGDGSLARKKGSILVQPIACVPEAAAEDGLQPAMLPEFATPEWLKENHHLMRADLRKLASAMAEDYSDWPAAVDGSDDAAFWRAVHTLAQRWAWFLWLFEERILELFGRVKGRKKQLGRLILKSAAQRALALRPAAPGGPEDFILDHLEALWEEGERVLVAQSVWVLWCSGGPESAYMMSSWLDEPEIERLVGARGPSQPVPGTRWARRSGGSSGPRGGRAASGEAGRACRRRMRLAAQGHGPMPTAG